MQTTRVLPAGHTVRAPKHSDAKAVFGLLSAYNTAVVGFADCTADEVAERLSNPTYDPATDCWLVLDGDGQPAGYAATCGKGNREVSEIELWSPDPAVAGWLYERSMRRAREMGREGGHPQITVDCCVYRADEHLRTLLADHDFTPGTTYHRMRMNHSGPVAAPAEPAGVVVRRGTFDDATQWAAHEVLIECFRGQYGFVACPHDEWIQAREARSTFDWSQMTVLEVDGRAIGLRDCNDGLVENENCGQIGMLGVLPEFQGRGLAKFLLRDAFAIDAAAGRASTMLYVDTNNPTPALGLYQSVGMKPDLVFDGWRRVLSAA